MSIDPEVKRIECTGLENFAMWTMLQPGGQRFDPAALKSLVYEWITMATQKTAGQEKYSQKGIPWDKESKAVNVELNIERVKMGILCEAVALVLSGTLSWIDVNDYIPPRMKTSSVPWPCSELMLVSLSDGTVGIALCEDNPAVGIGTWTITYGNRDATVTHWQTMPAAAGMEVSK